jgi:hypothetical protein
MHRGMKIIIVVTMMVYTLASIIILSIPPIPQVPFGF